MGDIGGMFPDTDRQYKDISSIKLLARVSENLKSRDISIINIDSVIVCQEPKVAPHVEEMKQNISRVLDIDVSRIGIKGKTTEGLGFTGRIEGIAAYAVCLAHV